MLPFDTLERAMRGKWVAERIEGQEGGKPRVWYRSEVCPEVCVSHIPTGEVPPIGAIGTVGFCFTWERWVQTGPGSTA